MKAVAAAMFFVANFDDRSETQMYYPMRKCHFREGFMAIASMQPATPVIDYEFGISAIDSGYQRPLLDAIHLVVEGGSAAVIDTGVNNSVPRVLAALRDKGLHPGQVDYVILTHIHLDHAGGAGLLLSQLPNARLTVHPRGARQGSIRAS